MAERSLVFDESSLPKTKMAMEIPHVQLEIHLQMVDLQLPCLFRGASVFSLSHFKDPMFHCSTTRQIEQCKNNWLLRVWSNYPVMWVL